MDASFFWSNARPLIREAGLTQSMLAEKLGLPFGTVQGWIAKSVLPRADVAVKIAQALNTSVEYLVTGKEREITKQDVINFLQKLP